jgi:hypothetical protein
LLLVRKGSFFFIEIKICLALDNLGFTPYKTNCLNAMETAQEEMAQKRRKLHGKSTSIYTDEELRQQQELLFQQVGFNLWKLRFSFVFWNV